jgi:opacity protein-like surface antigen
MISTLSAQVREEMVAKKFPHQEKKYSIAAQPLYNFNGGIRFDFEMRIKNSPAWIQISPSGYWMSRAHRDYNYWMLPSGELNYLLGGGLELNYKYFVNKKESIYFAGGCSYTNYNIEYADEYWRSYSEDNLVYYTKEHGAMKQGINKLGLNTYFGYQLPTPTFLFDMFVGLGYRYSFYTNNIASSFDDGMLSFGYRGIVFITGVRFGVKFK